MTIVPKHSTPRSHPAGSATPSPLRRSPGVTTIASISERSASYRRCYRRGIGQPLLRRPDP